MVNLKKNTKKVRFWSVVVVGMAPKHVKLKESATNGLNSQALLALSDSENGDPATYLWVRFFSATLWWTNILPWKITIFHGNIHYFYGHFQLQTVSSPEGTRTEQSFFFSGPTSCDFSWWNWKPLEAPSWWLLPHLHHAPQRQRACVHVLQLILSQRYFEWNHGIFKALLYEWFFFHILKTCGGKYLLNRGVWTNGNMILKEDPLTLFYKPSPRLDTPETEVTFWWNWAIPSWPSQ